MWARPERRFRRFTGLWGSGRFWCSGEDGFGGSGSLGSSGLCEVREFREVSGGVVEGRLRRRERERGCGGDVEVWGVFGDLREDGQGEGGSGCLAGLRRILVVFMYFWEVLEWSEEEKEERGGEEEVVGKLGFWR